MIVSISALRKFVPLALLVLVLALAGCDGDEEDESPPAAQETQTTDTTEETGPIIEETEVDPETERLPDDGDGTSEPAPEDSPGGAGDEEPAQTLALFTGVDGRITPPVVRVPAYISVRIELHSGDGAEYGLTFEGESIEVGGGLGSVSTTIDGLRPGARVILTPKGASNKVRIEATAEPGP
jgi:hypothetical protein